MIDRIFAIIGLALMISFCGVLLWSVPEIDLSIVLIVVLAMAVFEFWTSLRQSNNNRRT